MMQPQLKRAGLFLSALIAVMYLPLPGFADVVDFNSWTLVEDPTHPNFTSSVDSGSQITLSAIGGPIPVGTDIGYQSVNGIDVASSTSGWAFNPAFGFSVAVDFDLSFGSPSGGFSLGMGIGEDRDGSDSAGIILASQNGGFLTFGGGARVNDVSQSPIPIGVAGQTNGRLIVTYVAASGDVILGVSIDGDDTPEGSGTFSGIQNLWDDESLLVSFFARGDNGMFAWNSGTADAVFSNFHVISGAAFAVPEPSSFAMLAVGACWISVVRRRRQQIA